MARTLVGRLQLVVEAMGLDKAKKVESAVKSIEQTARRLSSAPWGQGFQRQIEKMALSAKEFDHVRTSWNRLQRDMSSRGLTAALKKSEISTWKTATLGHFASVRAGMRSTENEARKLAKVLDGVRRSSYIMLGGYSGVYMTGVFGREAIGASAERQREYFRQRMADIPDNERETIFQHSRELSQRYPSVNITDIMEMARTARNTMGSTERGMEVLDRMVQGFVTLQSANGVDAAPASIIGLMKGLDNLGTNADGEKGVRNVNNLIDAFIRASQIEGQDFDVRSIWEFAKRSRIAGPGLDPEFLATIAPAMIQDMGAGGAGTALAMAYKSFVIGANDVASKPNIAEQQRVGIRKGEGRGELVDSELFGTNPYQWVKKYLIPALQKDNVDIGNDTQVALAVAKLSRNSSATGMLTRMITQMPQYERLIALYNRGMGVEAAEQVRLNDPFVAWKGFQESLRNLSAAVGETVMPVIVPALNSLAGTINSFAALVQAQDPRVLGGAGILGAGAAAWGTWKVASGIWGLITAGASLQTAATMLQAAAVAQGGGVGDIPSKVTKNSGWLATLGLSAIAAAAAATLNLGQSRLLKTQSDIVREDRTNRGLAAYLANKPAGGGWRQFLFGEAAEPGFSFNDHLRMNLGGKDRAPATDQSAGAPPAKSDFGAMLSSVEAAVSRAVAASGNTDKATLDTGEYVSTAQNAGTQAKQALDVTASPKVDTASIDAFLAKVRAAAAELQRLASSATNIRSNVDAEMRRAYSDYGVVP